MMSRRLFRIAIYAPLSILILFSLAHTTLAVGIVPSESYYIYDKTGYLSEDYKKYIVNSNKALFSMTGAQIVVVTVEDTEDLPLEQYASELFSEWKIGSIERKNGILFIISEKENNYFVIKGKGFEDSLSDEDIKNLLTDKLEVHFNAGMYETGIISFFDSLVEKLEDIYNVSISEWNGKGGIYTNVLFNNSSEKASSVMRIIILIIISLIIVTILFLLISLGISRSKIYGRQFYSPLRFSLKKYHSTNKYGKARPPVQRKAPYNNSHKRTIPDSSRIYNNRGRSSHPLSPENPNKIVMRPQNRQTAYLNTKHRNPGRPSGNNRANPYSQNGPVPYRDIQSHRSKTTANTTYNTMQRSAYEKPSRANNSHNYNMRNNNSDYSARPHISQNSAYQKKNLEYSMQISRNAVKNRTGEKYHNSKSQQPLHRTYVKSQNQRQYEYR